MSHRGTQSRLTSLLMLTTRQQCLVLCIYFSGGCTLGYVMSTFVASQHHSCRTIQVFESLHIRKLVTHGIGHSMSVYTDRAAAMTKTFWLHYSGHQEVASECESSMQKCWLAEKCHLNITVFCRV